ncbi:MAG: energy transducer TonB [Gemmatimonadota bacterium]
MTPSGFRRPAWPAWTPAALLLLAPAATGCSDAVEPALGGLTIGRPDAAFQMPVMENEETPFGYPDAAWEAGQSGVVVLRIHIDPAGAVDSSYVKRSSGVPALDSAARADARRLRFRPARQGEDPVDVWATLPVRYPSPESPE